MLRDYEQKMMAMRKSFSVTIFRNFKFSLVYNLQLNLDLDLKINPSPILSLRC